MSHFINEENGVQRVGVTHPGWHSGEVTEPAPNQLQSPHFPTIPAVVQNKSKNYQIRLASWWNKSNAISWNAQNGLLCYNLQEAQNKIWYNPVSVDHSVDSFSKHRKHVYKLRQCGLVLGSSHVRREYRLRHEFSLVTFQWRAFSQPNLKDPILSEISVLEK